MVRILIDQALHVFLWSKPIGCGQSAEAAEKKVQGKLVEAEEYQQHLEQQLSDAEEQRSELIEVSPNLHYHISTCIHDQSIDHMH